MKIVLLKAGVEVGTIKDSTSIGSGVTGAYSWPILSIGSTGSDYKVSVQTLSQPTIIDSRQSNIFTSSWMNEGVLRVGFQRNDGHGAYLNVFMTNNMVSGEVETTSRLAKEDI